MRKKFAVLLALLFLTVRLRAQQSNNATGWQPWRFLVGEWTGEGTGRPGEGTGGFSFAFDLGEKIMVRRNRADYPATKDRPKYSHQDLMVVYAESDGKPDRAIYFDNEGHVIHYRAEFSGDGKSLTFLSDALPSQPRFRLAYTKTGDNALSFKFEISPPGKPDSFETYIQGRVHRKGSW